MTEEAIEVQCRLQGKYFYPSRLNLKNIQRANDPGEIGDIGKYNGKPRPYGSCTITTPDEVTHGQKNRMDGRLHQDK